MGEDHAAVLIYSTFGTAREAEAVGEALLRGRLAACVNILPGMVSLYEWKGRVERAGEVVMIIKTTGERAEAAVAEVERLHSYEQPSILMVPVIGGSDGFLAWIRAQTAPDRDPA